MPSQAQHLISQFRIIVLAVVTALLMTSAAMPMAAQNSVPPTARQAATMPQFAAKLAHGASRRPQPAQPRASYTEAFARTRGGWMPQGEIYDNGPINGTTDAWGINLGLVTTDSFTVQSGAGSVNGLTFGAWLFPGDVLQSVEVQITSAPFGGTTYTDQIVSFTQSGCSRNQYGFNVCTETGSLTNVNLATGTYWVNLDNAVVNDGDPLYWDENSGPSIAEESNVGTIPSEAFTVLGGGPPPPQCFQSQDGLQIIYSFTGQEGYGNGVTMDRAGHLYGTTPTGGNHSAGFAYKLTHFANWVLDPLYSFFGGTNGGDPTGAILGADGTLYGGAQGGIQNCGTNGSQYCGLVYNLMPPPTVCLTALCSWTENVPYRFSSEADGAGTINLSASDSEGNLYGTTTAGGSHDAGTVFELTRSGGGWTKTTLYSFTGNADGGAPTQVLVGNDGNLYGVGNGLALQPGIVFELMPSGGGWTESVLHQFRFTNYPSSLVQDSTGNLYGIERGAPWYFIFTLQKTGSGWVFNSYEVQHPEGDEDILNNLTIDASGQLYGTGYGGFYDCFPGQVCVFSYIFKASYGSGGWHYQDLDFLDNTYFASSGSLALDSSGNLYGTTYDCGTNSYGTVWQLSP